MTFKPRGSSSCKRILTHCVAVGVGHLFPLIPKAVLLCFLILIFSLLFLIISLRISVLLEDSCCKLSFLLPSLSLSVSPLSRFPMPLSLFNSCLLAQFLRVFMHSSYFFPLFSFLSHFFHPYLYPFLPASVGTSVHPGPSASLPPNVCHSTLKRSAALRVA